MSGRAALAPAGRIDPGCSGDLVEPARLHVVDEAPHLILPGDERAFRYSLDRVADVLFQVGKGSRAPLGPPARLLLEHLLELRVAEGEHPAVRVMDQHD